MIVRSLRAEAGTAPEAVAWSEGLRASIFERDVRSDAAAWGGFIGVTWMLAYWVALIPVWVWYVASMMSAL